MNSLADVAVEPHGTTVLLVVTGEVDTSNAEDVEAALATAAEGAEAVVIDLTGVTYLDSAALHGVWRLVEAGGQRPLLVVAPTGSIARRLLDLVSFPRLPLHDTVEAALAAAEA